MSQPQHLGIFMFDKEIFFEVTLTIMKNLKTGIMKCEGMQNIFRRVWII